MAILNASITQASGVVGVLPSIAYIATNDTEATVLGTGYLNGLVAQGFSFSLPCVAAVSTQADSSSKPIVGWYNVSHSGSNWSLTATVAPGDVVLPTTANYIAHFTDVNGTLSSAADNVINAGNIQAGLSGTAGALYSYPGTAAKGKLIVAGVANTGNTDVTISNAAHGQASVYSIPDSGAAAANFIVSKLTGTQHITVGALQVDAGIISSGISTGGTAGGFTAYPATASNGSLKIVPVGNAGDFATTISNSAAQSLAQVVTIPDSGLASANFLLSSLVGGGIQHITAGALEVDAGALISGIGTGGFVGLVKAFPTTATAGFIAMQAAANASGNFGLTISNSTAQAQATVLTIPDVGAATGFLNPQSVSANLTPASVLIKKDITLGFAALAAAGKVEIQAALPSARFKIRDIFVNYSAAGLGGGGDRLIVISDGTTVYNNAGITAALLGTPVNTVWGGTGNPLAGTVAQNTSTAAGAQIFAQYSGGTTDYTSGSVVITVTYERVA